MRDPVLTEPPLVSHLYPLRSNEVVKVTRPAPYVLAVLICLSVSGCAQKVQYGDPGAAETLTVDFGSTDLQMIAEKMITSLLTSPVISQGTRPVVLVSRVRNKTDEHIDTKAITDKIRTTLLQSGRVRFVAGEVRDEVIRELEYQAASGHVDEATRKGMGKMVGADYLLTGAITSIRKEAGRKMDVYFQFNLNLTALETGLIEWAEEKDIRKERQRPLVGW